MFHRLLITRRRLSYLLAARAARGRRTYPSKRAPMSWCSKPRLLPKMSKSPG